MSGRHRFPPAPSGGRDDRGRGDRGGGGGDRGRGGRVGGRGSDDQDRPGGSGGRDRGFGKSKELVKAYR